ncbi:Hypothetical protein CINCED_3A019273, partial [Cinara cedri]
QPPGYYVQVRFALIFSEKTRRPAVSAAYFPRVPDEPSGNDDATMCDIRTGVKYDTGTVMGYRVTSK